MDPKIKELLEDEINDFINEVERNNKTEEFKGKISFLQNMNIDELTNEKINKSRKSIQTWLKEIE